MAECADRLLLSSSLKRAVADYPVGTAWDSEDASRLVEDAAAFVQRIQDYLRSAGVTIEE